MSISPYTPTPFTTPIANPAVGGAGVAYPYVSVSQFQFAPTALDTTNLVPGGDEAAQIQALADVLRRASGAADRYCFGADPAAKGASLCASLSVEDGYFPLIDGELRLVCDYKPIVQVNAIDVGSDPSTVATIGSTAAATVRIGRRTIYVPVRGFAVRAGDYGNPNPGARYAGRLYSVWSYVNGYPHTLLAADIAAGANTCTVQPTDGASGLLGIFPGSTTLTIVDGAQTESFVVQSLSGTTLTSTTKFQFAHSVPAAPDAIPVTSLPADVQQAVIFLAMALIKTQGDNSLVLDEVEEPKRLAQSVGGEPEDVRTARELLKPFVVRIKAKN